MKQRNSLKNKRLSNKSSPSRPIPDSFYKELTDEIAEGIVSLDLEGNIVYINNAASNLLKVAKDRIIGKHFKDFVDTTSSEQAKKYFQSVKIGQTVSQRVIKVKARNGAVIPVEFTASPTIEDGKVVALHAIFRDISEKTEMEAVLRETEKMNAIQHFIAGAAQEIKSPLLGLTERLERITKEYESRDFEYIGYKEFKNIFSTLRAMRDRAKYCYDTTEKLINISKRRQGIDGLSCDVNDTIKSVLQKVRFFPKGTRIDFKLRLGKDLPKAAIGSIELSQALLNILTNAVQAITHDGVIKIKTSYLKKTDNIIIECVDNGVGIAKEEVNKVFEPFYTTKQRGVEKSSGLGLSIVYSIAKNHKGDVVIKSSLREGTQVTLSFPKAK